MALMGMNIVIASLVILISAVPTLLIAASVMLSAQQKHTALEAEGADAGLIPS